MRRLERCEASLFYVLTEKNMDWHGMRPFWSRVRGHSPLMAGALHCCIFMAFSFA